MRHNADEDIGGPGNSRALWKFIKSCRRPTAGDVITHRAWPSNIKADISVILLPFPKVPILISYWKPEDGLESELHLFFDGTAEENLNIESIFSLGAGIANMLEKIMLKHV